MAEQEEEQSLRPIRFLVEPNNFPQRSEILNNFVTYLESNLLYSYPLEEIYRSLSRKVTIATRNPSWRGRTNVIESLCRQQRYHHHSR